MNDDNQGKGSSSAYIIWGLVVLLIILHQDNWLWENGTLVFGFMPIGLVYHACISVCAAITWFLATKFAWPDVDDSDPAITTASAATAVPSQETTAN